MEENSINLDKSLIYTFRGLFKKNKIYTEDNIIPCITYGSVKQEIEDKYGWYNIIFDKDICQWVVFQYLLE